MTNSVAGSELPLMATVNDVIDQLHGSLGLTDSEFFCECGQSDCKERINLTRTEYARLRDEDGAVLVAEHAHRRPGMVGQPRGLRLVTPASHQGGHQRGC